MDIDEAIRTRRSIRAYKPDPMPRNVLEKIVDTCQWAASDSNTQPWEFAIVGAAEMKELKARIIEKIEAKEREQRETPFLRMPEPYAKRAVDNRTVVNSYVFPPGTEDLDNKMKAHGRKGAIFYDALNAIIVYTDKSLGIGDFTEINIGNMAMMNIGIMAQTVCLAALSHGLGTCIMGPRWTGLLRQRLGISESKAILLSVAIGYPDFEARINNFPRARLPLDSWAHWHGF
jgi:nitroreductase